MNHLKIVFWVFPSRLTDAMNLLPTESMFLEPVQGWLEWAAIAQ